MAIDPTRSGGQMGGQSNRIDPTQAGWANETVVTYEHDGQTYEIDHLGAGEFDQWGEFAVYCGADMIATFAIAESLLKPEFRPDALPPDAELITLAKAAVAEFFDGEVA